MFKKNILLLSFLMVIIVLTVSACSSTESNSSNDDKINGETKINEATVEYLGEKFEKPQAVLYFFLG